MIDREKTYRLFFALWPSSQVRQSMLDRLYALSPPVKGRVMQPKNLHITLHYIGQVTESSKHCLHAAAQSVNAPGFQLNLDCFGYFPKAKIFWMGCGEVAEELTQLHSTLGTALTQCGYQQEKRAYAPHITLMRKCVNPGARQGDFSIPWSVNEFVLVESVTHQQGVEYRVIEKYALK